MTGLPTGAAARPEAGREQERSDASYSGAMATSEHCHYGAAPSALTFMARALLLPRRPGIGARAPALAATWHDHRVTREPLEAVLDLTDLRESPSWPVVYPQVIGFRLQMAVLTNRAFPLPIWTSLQVRNHLVLHAPIAPGDTLALCTRVAAQRVLDRGVEIDLHSMVHADGSLRWEGVTTFYYRGHFGMPGSAASLATAPRVEGPHVARWLIPTGGGLRFGKLTGDYNGIHLWGRYARLFGFRRAFLHPQRVLGACLARLPHADGRLPLRLDAWLKGPVFYGTEVALSAGATGFALHVGGDERPAIVGRLTAGPEATFLPILDARG